MSQWKNSIISEKHTYKRRKILPFLIFKMGINTHKFRNGDIVKLSSIRTHAWHEFYWKSALYFRYDYGMFSLVLENINNEINKSLNIKD